MTRISACWLQLVGFGVLGCGGRIDVAEVDRNNSSDEAALQGQVDGPSLAPTEPSPGPFPSGPTPAPAEAENILGIAPVMPPIPPPMPRPVPSEALIDDSVATGVPPPDESACFDPEVDAQVTWKRVPTGGCVFQVSGDDRRCAATWSCCGVDYEVIYEPDADDPEVSWVHWDTDAGDGGFAVGPEDTPTCPLFDLEAAALAARAFDYSPAWETAVRQTLGETESAPELDPIPAGCTYLELPNCGAKLTCPEHVYQVGFDDEGELQCERDGIAVEPQLPEAPPALCVNPEHDVPADPCFGYGWLPYFRWASGMVSTSDE